MNTPVKRQPIPVPLVKPSIEPVPIAVPPPLSSPMETAKTDLPLTDRQRFMLRMSPIAKDVERKTGISAAILITQAAHESNWGISGLTEKANNLFGFTGESWQKRGKPVIFMKTKEFIKGRWITVERPFRSYASWEESVEDWTRLMHTDNYSKAFDVDGEPIKSALDYLKANDIDGFGKAVHRAGYATDPSYPTRLVALHEKVNEALA